MNIFDILRELDLDIFAFIELPSFMSDQTKIMFLMALKARGSKRRAQ